MFIRSQEKAPAVLVLDFDATDAPIHGGQEERFFHGYYGCHCRAQRGASRRLEQGSW